MTPIPEDAGQGCRAAVVLLLGEERDILYILYLSLKAVFKMHIGLIAAGDEK